MKLRVLTILLAIIAMALGARAQVVDTSFYKAQRGHYVSLEAGYGVMSMLHGMSDAQNTTDLQYGVQARFSYRWYILRYWALGTGLHYQKMGTKSVVNNMQHIPDAVDELGRTIEHRTQFHNLEETASAHVFSVPAGMYLHGIQLFKRMKMNFGAGVMFNFSLNNSYKTTGGLDTRLYYDDYHLELSDVKGHNVYSASGFSGKYTVIPSLSLFAEFGFIHSLNRRIDLTLTFLGAYGLNPFISSDKYLYDPDCKSADAYQNMKYNGVLGSEEAYGVRFLNLGGLFGVRYHIGTYNIDVDDLERARRRRTVEDIEFERQRQQEFEELERRKRQQQQEEDSLLSVQEEERKRRELEDPEFIRQQRQRDSIAALDSLRIALDDTKMDAVFTEVVRVELDTIIAQLNHNHCKFNESRLELTRAQRKCIDRLAFLMTTFPSINIICIGHTCDIGSVEQNKSIGLKRAQAFAQELIDRGVSPDRIECQTKWFTEPLVPNTSEKNREINRRVEVKRK